MSGRRLVPQASLRRELSDGRGDALVSSKPVDLEPLEHRLDGERALLLHFIGRQPFGCTPRLGPHGGIASVAQCGIAPVAQCGIAPVARCGIAPVACRIECEHLLLELAPQMWQHVRPR